MLTGEDTVLLCVDPCDLVEEGSTDERLSPPPPLVDPVDRVLITLDRREDGLRWDAGGARVVVVDDESPVMLDRRLSPESDLLPWPLILPRPR